MPFSAICRQPLVFAAASCLPAAAGLCLLLTGTPHSAMAQQKTSSPATISAASALSIDAKVWAERAAEAEVAMINGNAYYLRGRMRRTTPETDQTRDFIESTDGMVSRTVMDHGRVLSAEKDADERDRLEHLLDNPGEFYRHHRQDQSEKDRAARLILLMPEAMIYTYAADQTPAANDPVHAQVVIDYSPDPKFKPPTLEADALTGLAGRIWIETDSHHVVRMEGHLIHDVSVGWGLLGCLYKGGAMVLEQGDAGGGRWTYTHLTENVAIRVVIKTIHLNVITDWTDFQFLSNPEKFQDAIHSLLSMPLPAK